MTNITKRLTYFKCLDCLSSMTSFEHPTMCACGGVLETMGAVFGQNYGKEEEKCACDERCTHASGPNCTCSCLGANHGTGKVVEVVTILGVVKVKEIDAEAMGRADAFRRVFAQAKELMLKAHAQVAADIAANKYVSNGYWEYHNAKRELNKIRGLKVHKTRMNRLYAFIAENTKEELTGHDANVLKVVCQ